MPAKTGHHLTLCMEQYMIQFSHLRGGKSFTRVFYLHPQYTRPGTMGAKYLDAVSTKGYLSVWTGD